MSDIHERFRAARQFEPDLTPRQREILALIAAGRTNTEIAAAYDITPDGAKWHVSEIYSKLGLASREEAAAYWHWRNGIGSKLVAFLRALVPAAVPLKVAGAIAGSLATITIFAVALVLSRSDDPPLKVGGPYTATVLIDELDYQVTIEHAYQDATHRKASFSTDGGKSSAATLYDGAMMHVVVDSSYYTSVPIPVEPEPSTERGRLLAVFAARLTGTAPATTLPDLLEELGDQTGAEQPVRVVGHERYLGRAVTVLEAGPISTDVILGDTSRPPYDLTYRILVDDESLIIMAWDTPIPEGGKLTGRVTELDLSPTFAPDTFVFTPAAGAVAATPTLIPPPAGWQDATRLSIPAGFLAAAAPPPGMQLLDSKANPDGEPRLFAHFGRAGTSRTGTGEPFVDLTQQTLPASNPPDPRPYETVPFPIGNAARLFTSPNGELALQIFIATNLVTITTNELTRQQLIDWANTLQLRQ